MTNSQILHLVYWLIVAVAFMKGLDSMGKIESKAITFALGCLWPMVLFVAGLVAIGVIIFESKKAKRPPRGNSRKPPSRTPKAKPHRTQGPPQRTPQAPSRPKQKPPAPTESWRH